MKLLLHYLRYDWQRSRALFHALWTLLALHGVMVWLGHEELKVSWMADYYRARIPASWQNAAFVCRILCGLCAVVLCLAAGRADSPVQETWQSTRPGAAGDCGRRTGWGSCSVWCCRSRSATRWR